jgi:hypothetical protein
MKKKQLEDMVNGIQRPNLIDSEVKLLLNKEDANIKPIPRPQPVAQPRPQPVAQPYHKPVAQPKPQPVAQVKPKVVAQEVAQDTWVAQDVAKVVAQPKPTPVAQDRPQVVAQSKPKPVAQRRLQSTLPRVKDSEELLIDKDVNELKDQIFQIQGVEERKKFIKDIGWGVMGEKRGKKYYLFGAKKISGRKYKLYIGNATN